MKSLIGKFLLASQTLEDPNFARAVVLIIRHDDDGAFGLIINRPMRVSVGEAIGSSIESAIDYKELIHFGGPCQGPVFVLHKDYPTGGDEPIEGVYITTDRDAIEQLIQKESNPIKLFASYSGWSSGQLETEIADGSWLICEAVTGDIFDADNTTWQRLFTRTNLEKFIDPGKIPEDPSAN